MRLAPRRKDRAGLGSPLCYPPRPPRQTTFSRSRSFGDNRNVDEGAFDERDFMPASHGENGRAGAGSYGPEQFRERRPTRRAAFSRNGSFGDGCQLEEETVDEHGFVPTMWTGFGRGESGRFHSEGFHRQRPTGRAAFTRSRSLGNSHDFVGAGFRESVVAPAAHRDSGFESEVPSRFVAGSQRAPRSRRFQVGMPRDFDHGRSLFGTPAAHGNLEPWDDRSPCPSSGYGTPPDESPFDLISGDRNNFGLTSDVFNSPLRDDPYDFHGRRVSPARGAYAPGLYDEPGVRYNRGRGRRRTPRYRVGKKRKITPVVSEEPSGIEPDARELSNTAGDGLSEGTLEGLEVGRPCSARPW